MVADGYKQTEVGVIPEDWGVVELGEISTFLDGKRRPIKASDRAKMKGGYPYYGASGIVDFVNDYIYNEDLILLGEDGENIISRNLPLAFQVSGKIWVNNHAHVIKPNSDTAIGFLTEYLESLNYEKLNSGTAQPKLNKQKCLAIGVAYPPTLAEQEAIAGALSDADGLIESLEQLIHKKRQIKQGAMQELLSPWEKETPAMDNGKVIMDNDASAQHSQFSTINSPLKLSTIHYPLKKGWVEKTLGGVLIGKELGGNYQNSEDYGGEVLIKMGNICRNQISLKKIEKMITGFNPNSSHRLSYGDVLFNTRNTLDLVGKVSIWRNEFEVAYYNSNLMRMTFCPKLVGSQFYMNYLLNTKGVIAQLRGVAIGTTSVAAIYSRDFNSITLHLPSRNEQARIATILSDMDEEISTLETKLLKAKQIKQGMMQELLTGKTRLV